MSAALLAIAGAWLVTGWLALSTSRRMARLWAAVALTLMASANAVQIAQASGPWWPLLHWPWSAIEAIAAVLWIAGLALAFRARERGWRAGQLVLVCGVAAFAFGLITATAIQLASTNHQHARGRACLGTPASLGQWTATLHEVRPVVDADYTGVQARLGLGFPDGVVRETRPERRDYLVGGPGPLAGSETLLRWNGELLVETTVNRNWPDCVELMLEWQPFAQWLRYGAWLSLAGTIMLLAGAWRSACWRAAARKRISMRRADQGRDGLPLSRIAVGWKPLGLAAICGVIAFAWQAGQQTSHAPARRGIADGPAMIAARQALFGGPHLDNRWLVIADALARHGQFGEAAQVLQGAVEKEPRNAEAWLALGDALYGHAGGSMVAAAELAYGRADRLAAFQAGSDSLAAKAMAASGRDREAAVWSCHDPRLHPDCGG